MACIDVLQPLIEKSVDLGDDGVGELAYYQKEDVKAIFALESGASLHGWSEKNILGSLNSSHHCIGLRCDNEWVAHAVISFAADEAELLVFAVAKSWQGRGVGSKFLSTLISCLAHYASELFLEVRESNRAAISLYEKLGFNQLGERANYYPLPSGRENALIFGLTLFLEM